MQAIPHGNLHLRRKAVSSQVIVIGLIVIVAVAGVATFAFVFTGTGSAGTRSSSQTSGTTTSMSSGSGTHSSSATSSLQGSGFRYYKGTYSYGNPLGPGGVRLNSSGSVETYSTVQTASGSFTFFINPANHTGVGNGQGTMTATTSGFCSGTTTFQYTFKVTNANDLLGGNITVAFADPSPGSFFVPLACTGSLIGVDTSVNNPLTFLPVFPNLVSVRTVPTTVSQHLSGNIIYQFTITPS